MTTFKIRLAVAALALCVSLPSAAAAQSNPCKLRKVAALDLSTSPDGAMMVPIGVDGRQYSFDYDVSNTLTGVGRRPTQELNLSSNQRPVAHNVEIGFADNKVEYIDTVHDIEVGGVRFTQSEVLDLSGILPPGVDGVIGSDLLSKLDDELDLDKNRLNLFLPAQCGEQVVYWQADKIAAIPMHKDPMGSIFFDGQLDGRDISVSFSMSDRGISMDASYLKTAFGIYPDDPRLTKRPSGERNGVSECANTQCYRYPFKELSVDGFVIKNPDVVIYKSVDDIPHHTDRFHNCRNRTSLPMTDPAPVASRVPSNQDKYRPVCFMTTTIALGFDVLRQLHLYFASKQHMLYVTPASKAPPPTRNAVEIE